jgi:hypothetical protein
MELLAFVVAGFFLQTMPDVNANFSSVNTSFNLRYLNLIMHLAYCIDLDFHSFHLTKVSLHIKDSKMRSISNSLLFVTDIYLRFIRKVKLKKIYQYTNLIKNSYNKLNLTRNI